ncbi:MAG: chromate transporter [Filifactoraceae bacterium]
MRLLLQVVWIFTKIGMFTIGGGYAMIPEIKRQIVNKNNWITDEEFLDIIAITQSMPGPIAVNVAFVVGYKLRGLLGGLLASVGAVFPSLVMMIGVAIGYREIRDNEYVIAAFKGIKPVVVALVFLGTFSLAKTAKISIKNFYVPAIVSSMILFLGVSPLWILFASFVFGNIYFWNGRGQR